MLFSKVVMIDVRSWCMGGVFVCLLVLVKVPY